MKIRLLKKLRGKAQKEWIVREGHKWYHVCYLGLTDGYYIVDGVFHKEEKDKAIEYCNEKRRIYILGEIGYKRLRYGRYVKTKVVY